MSGKIKKIITVGLVDDHELICRALCNLIENTSLSNDNKYQYRVVLQAHSGVDMTNKIKDINPPDIILLDVNMPGMDGYESALWLRDNYPTVKILALSMYNLDSAIIRMLKYGAKGYLLKNIDPPELFTALDSTVDKGFYYGEHVLGKLSDVINSMAKSEDENPWIKLNEREIELIKLLSLELTYKEIADKMMLSPRTIDGYRDTLFEKLKVKTRIGIVMYGIINGIINVNIPLKHQTT